MRTLLSISYEDERSRLELSLPLKESNMITSEQESGGFLPTALPSPPASSAAAGSLPASPLPQPRTHPLKASSAKESKFVDYVDRKLLDISGKYERRFVGGEDNSADESANQSDEHGRAGYRNFGEVATDLDAIVDVVWVSGTRMASSIYIVSEAHPPLPTGPLTATGSNLASLQIPLLLTIALAITTYLPSSPFSPRRLFSLLDKLDLAFASLLRGRDVASGEPLPGFEHDKRQLTTTQKVRLRGIVERTRVAVVDVAGKAGGSASVVEDVGDEDVDMGLTTETEPEQVLDGLGEETRGWGDWEMEIARVYERTVVDLGASLDTSGSESLG